MKKMKNTKDKIENNKLKEIMERHKHAHKHAVHHYAHHHVNARPQKYDENETKIKDIKQNKKLSLGERIKRFLYKSKNKEIQTSNKINKKENKISKITEEIGEEEKRRREKIKRINKYLTNAAIASFAIGLIGIFITQSLKVSGIIILIVFVLINTFFITRQLLKKSAQIKKMEDVFPDFIELMASNLRAGMTIDKALLLSSRKEFAPLDEEILNLGKDIMTGRELTQALIDLGKRIKSEKIVKTINVINSGIRSGGNLAILLEQTATNTRERNFVEKRAASNVLMYIIFIFFAVAIGAPLLFSLSTVLVQVLTTILGGLPSIDSTVNIPIALTAVSISTKFILYFAIIFIVVIDILASLLLGLVSKGEEKQGLKYMAPLIALSITVFFIIRSFLSSYFEGII